MIVPHADERPVRPRIGKVGIGEITFIGGAIVDQIDRDVIVGDLASGGIADDVADLAPVIRLLAVFRIPHHLVDEIAQMQDEIELLGFRLLPVVIHHAPVGIVVAGVLILTADKGEIHRAIVGVRGRGPGAPDAAAHALGVGEAIPVGRRRLEAGREHAHRPVVVGQRHHRGRRDHVPERLVPRNLDGQFRGGCPGVGGLRVHRITLSNVGSPEATPSGYRSRRSFQTRLDVCAALAENASDAPIAVAASANSRRLSPVDFLSVAMIQTSTTPGCASVRHIFQRKEICAAADTAS